MSLSRSSPISKAGWVMHMNTTHPLPLWLLGEHLMTLLCYARCREARAIALVVQCLYYMGRFAEAEALIDR